MSELLKYQMAFARLVPRLIDHAHLLGFGVTIAEVYRPNVTAELYAIAGVGSKQSVHPLRLAIDLNLFRDGVWLTKSEDHRALGLFWERQHPLARWGGLFSKPDGNHYSLSWGGRA